MGASYKTAITPEHFKKLRTQHAELIQDPPLKDTLISVVYRDIQDKRPAVTGALVVAGKQTRKAHPATQKEPLHFLKVYHPGARANTLSEHERTERASKAAKLGFFPTPLGADVNHTSPFNVDDNQVLRINPHEEVNLYRSKVVPGITLSAASPLPKGHYLADEVSPKALSTANRASGSQLKKLWAGVETAYEEIKLLHKGGCAHCDGHRLNLLMIDDGETYKPALIDYETARFREDMTEEEWGRRTQDDFDEVYREAIYLQHTKLGPQPTELGRNALARQHELLSLPESSVELAR